MFDLKIFDKIKAKFQWSNNRKTALKADAESQLAHSENGQVIQLQVHNHFDIKDVQQLALNSNGDVPMLLQNATSRLALEQVVKQDNLEKTVKEAKLEAINEPKPFEKDWFMEWMSVAQTISKEEIRKILAAILKKEAQDGHSTSLKTLEVLKTIEKDELELFKLFCNVSFKLAIEQVPQMTLVVAEPYGNPSKNAMKEIGLSYESLTKLQDLGLIKADLTSNHPGVGIVVSNSWPFFIGPKLFVPTEKYEPVKDYQVQVILFTKVGQQLRECLELERNTAYEAKFSEWVSKKFKKKTNTTQEVD